MCLEQNYERVAFAISGGRMYRNRYHVVSQSIWKHYNARSDISLDTQTNDDMTFFTQNDFIW